MHLTTTPLLRKSVLKTSRKGSKLTLACLLALSYLPYTWYFYIFSGGALLEAAEKLNDEPLLLQIRDLVAIEVRYHRSCNKDYIRVIYKTHSFPECYSLYGEPFQKFSVRVGARRVLASYTSCALLVLTRRQNRLIFWGSNDYFSLTLKVLLQIPLILHRQDAFNRHAPFTRRDRKTRQDAYTLNKTPRPARCFPQARSLHKTRSQNTTRRLHMQQDAKTCKTLSTGTLPSQDAIAKHDKTPMHWTRRQDPQDAFNRHAPFTRRDRKTRQDAFAHNKMPWPARRFQQARCLDKTRSQNTTTRLHTQQDAKTRKTLSTGTLPSQVAIAKHDKTHTHSTRRQDLQDAFHRHAPFTRRDRKTRQDAYTCNKTPRPARRFQQARSLHKTRSQNTTRRLCTEQDPKTRKTLSTGTLPSQDAIAKHDKTHSLITRRQDPQDAFNRHAASTRRDRKTRQDAYTRNKTPRPARRFQQARSLHKSRSQNMTRRLRTEQDAKTRKTLSTGTLPRQDAIAKHDNTHTHSTRRQDLQDAFHRHAPFTRRDLKTRQDPYALNKTPRPARRFQQARSLHKTRSQNSTRRLRTEQDAKTYKTLSTGTLPRQDAIAKHDKTPTHWTRRQDPQDSFNRHAPFTRRDRKTRQDAYALNKTPRPARRFPQARSLHQTRSQNTPRRLRTEQDAKTRKTLSTGTLPSLSSGRSILLAITL